MHPSKNLLVRRWRLILFVSVIVLSFVLIYILRSAIIPFLLGMIIAYLLLPIIRYVERHIPVKGKHSSGKRIFSILLVFFVLIALVGFLSYYIVVSIIEASLLLVENAPQYLTASVESIREWSEGLHDVFPAEMQEQVDSFLLESGNTIGNALKELVNRGISFIPSTFSLIIGFFSLPIFLFFLLRDSEKLKESLYNSLPGWWSEHVRTLMNIIEKVLGRYIRAQLMLGLVVGYLCFIGLLILQIPFAPVLALIAGVTEMIPMLGPWIGALFAVIITLAFVPEKIIWVLIIYGTVQLLENNLLVPRIQGGYLHIHPAVLMVLLVLGAYIAGFWGVILVAPLTATIVEIFKYIQQIIASSAEDIPKHVVE